jgi:hypothetical protein
MVVCKTNVYENCVGHIFVEQISIEQKNAYVLSIEKNVNLPTK